MSKLNRTSLALAGAALALGLALPAVAQTTTVPGTMTSSPAGRDAQGHAADSTTPAAHAGMNHGMASTKGSTSSMVASDSTTDTPVKTKPARTNMTPENMAPGAGNRNGGNAVPPTSGAAGR